MAARQRNNGGGDALPTGEDETALLSGQEDRGQFRRANRNLRGSLIALPTGAPLLSRHFQNRLHHAAFQGLTQALGEVVIGVVAQRDHVGDAQQAPDPEIYHR